MADNDGEDTMDTGITRLPFIWECVKPVAKDASDPASSGADGHTPVPSVGKLLHYLSEIEETEELEAKVTERDPETGHSLLLWATLMNKFILVEWLIKKCARVAFAFDNKQHDLTIFDKWREVRQEEQERERKRIQMEETNPEGDKGDEDEEENKEPIKPTHAVVLEQLSDTLMNGTIPGATEEALAARIRSIGNLGVYQGNRTEDGTKHAVGQYLYPSGDAFVGEYENNVRNGTGTYMWGQSGIIYTGEWRDGMRCGIGRTVYPDGGRYYGAWWNNTRSGHGQYTYPNGDTYTGEWYQDVRCGTGTLTFHADGSKYIGVWDPAGQFVRGEWKMPCGLRYLGSFRDMKPHGHGFYVFPSGTYQEGYYACDGTWTPNATRTLREGHLLPPHGSLRHLLVPQLTMFGRDVRLSSDLATGGFPLLIDATSGVAIRRWLSEHQNQYVGEPLQIVEVEREASNTARVRSIRVKVSPERTLRIYEDSVALVVVLTHGKAVVERRVLLLVPSSADKTPQPGEDTGRAPGPGATPQVPQVHATQANELEGEFIRAFCTPRAAKTVGRQAPISIVDTPITLPLHSVRDTLLLKAHVPLNEDNVVHSVSFHAFVHPVVDKDIWKQLLACTNADGSRFELCTLEHACSVVRDSISKAALQCIRERMESLPTQTTGQRVRPPTPPPPMLLLDLPVVEPLLPADEPHDKEQA